jgi:hypothetical protein
VPQFAAVAEQSRVPAEMPLVGRAEVLQRILDGLGVPGATAFVLAGKAAVGKTRLAAEVRRAVLEQGRRPSSPSRWFR